MAKALCLLALVTPGAWTAALLALGALGPRPVEAMLHASGDWAIRILFVALAVAPLAREAAAPRLFAVRRMIGVAAFAYSAAHISFYAADEAFALLRIATEIARRIYLAIGFLALLGLAALAATSTDRMARRLGRRWRRLHRASYAIALLAVVHFFLQARAGSAEPMVMGGLFVWLMAYRLLARNRRGPLGALRLAGLTLAVAASVALGESAYIALKFGLDPLAVAAVQLSPEAGLRPAWVVAFAGALVVLTAGLSRGGYRP